MRKWRKDVLLDINAKTDMMFGTLETRAMSQVHSHHDRQWNPSITEINIDNCNDFVKNIIIIFIIKIESFADNYHYQD